MQTFLPYNSFSESAKVLDRSRLGKQRVEVLQLLRAIRGQTKGWSNHPAARMWRGYEAALVQYGIDIVQEWVNRGYKDTCKDKIIAESQFFNKELILPPWVGNNKFHASHRSNLLRKNPDHYGKFGWSESNNLEYVWPV